MAEETKQTSGAPEEETAAPPEQEQKTPAAEEAQPEKSKKDKKPKKLSELEKLQSDFNDLNDRYMRLAAEYDNFRKRSQREREQIWPDATAAAVAPVLAVADNFERAVAASCADAEYKKGMELTFRSLTDALAKIGVEAFGEENEAFDPARHNAVIHIDDETLGAGVVVQVLQKGYRLGDKVLRYAMVKVAN